MRVIPLTSVLAPRGEEAIFTLQSAGGQPHADMDDSGEKPAPYLVPGRNPGKLFSILTLPTPSASTLNLHPALTKINLAYFELKAHIN